MLYKIHYVHIFRPILGHTLLTFHFIVHLQLEL